METRWKASLSVSALHAATCHAQGLGGVDPEFACLIAEPTDMLVATIRTYHLDPLDLLPAFTNWASDFENNRQLVEIALGRAYGIHPVPPSLVSPLAAAIAHLESVVLAARPEIVDELALRARPLQQQWSARGPGLMKELARLTAENFVASAAEIMLVMPWIGGAGRADSKNNRVLIEAVLANPHADLPETLRLGWLLAQLNVDLPEYAEAIPTGRCKYFAKLAAVPAILAAAETVEWSSCSAATIERALECWHIARYDKQLADVLFRWWRTYCEGKQPWAIAWRALAAFVT